MERGGRRGSGWRERVGEQQGGSSAAEDCDARSIGRRRGRQQRYAHRVACAHSGIRGGLPVALPSMKRCLAGRFARIAGSEAQEGSGVSGALRCRSILGFLRLRSAWLLAGSRQQGASGLADRRGCAGAGAGGARFRRDAAIARRRASLGIRGPEFLVRSCHVEKTRSFPRSSDGWRWLRFHARAWLA